jgi:hypothetical protein
MEELTTDYSSGALHPDDLKLALAESLNKISQVFAWPSSFFALPDLLMT